MGYKELFFDNEDHANAIEVKIKESRGEIAIVFMDLILGDEGIRFVRFDKETCIKFVERINSGLSKIK